jgi:hypothetical protein
MNRFALMMILPALLLIGCEDSPEGRSLEYFKAHPKETVTVAFTCDLDHPDWQREAMTTPPQEYSATTRECVNAWDNLDAARAELGLGYEEAKKLGLGDRYQPKVRHRLFE